MKDNRKLKFLSVILGNIVICATIAALLFVTVTPNAENTAVQGEDKPHYSGNSESCVSLMVNVYWGTEYIQPMLDIFAAHGMQTTFFIGGTWAVGNTETLKAIAAAGHELGNHGYYHKDHKKLDAAYNRKEISSTHDAVKEITGIEMTLFAPPSGAFGNVALATAKELGYKTVMWTRDTIDWRDHDSELIYKRAVRDIKGGDLILMHPTDSTVKALDRIITTIEDAGLTVAPVSVTLGDGTA